MSAEMEAVNSVSRLNDHGELCMSTPARNFGVPVGKGEVNTFPADLVM